MLPFVDLYRGQGFADVLNKIAGDGYARWELGGKQDGLLFWGARNVDGRGFDTEANRPTNLQIPLMRA